MKKTFLSLAFVLSISLVFGAETKPVVGDVKTKISNEQILQNKIKYEPAIGTFYTSCGEVIDMYYQEMPSMEQIECDMAFFEKEYCEEGPGCD